MKLKVKLVSHLRKYGKGKLDSRGKLTVKDGLTVKELLDYLEIPPEKKVIVLVNQREASKEHQLSAEDDVVIYNLLLGG